MYFPETKELMKICSDCAWELHPTITGIVITLVLIKQYVITSSLEAGPYFKIT